MTEIILTSKAEERASLAENLKAFSGVKLLHIKRQVASILSQIGKNGIFDEYTKHDISHINYMLDSLEWIIPENTKAILTNSDWLMITLSIYFHDLGMLVTKDEFNGRANSKFPAHKQSILKGDFGLDYKDKILAIVGEEAQDRFMYQEWVRRTHAERIKYWILNEPTLSYPKDLTIISEIKSLTAGLDIMFRRDLALICESHHLSDLDDLDKYKPNQQYGPTKDEKVNLHYAALVLRTADLLHITSDRTPSIEYNLINPNDPISQEEWAKQQAVKTVRIQEKKDKDGKVDPGIPSDTFEVIAFFNNEKGFFGLISYLNYASGQLKENFKANESANKLISQVYEYPWKNIDDTSIETADFEKRQFEFRLDQTKILNLLVGHTLYNDPTVVLRELTQNGIDATKLKEYEITQSKSLDTYDPTIKISWTEETRELMFTDNGTGMTLEIIENHLLKVGSSRYQDEEFKRKFPGFSPISRFGIGLLTCFLIADDIDIVTKSSESEKAILLKIRKVHGKYLLKYLNQDKIPIDITNHGTILKLHVRADVNLKNIEEELNKWILFPKCKMVLELNKKSFNIGYESPKHLLTSYLTDSGYKVDEKNIKIKEISVEGVTIAFALAYREHWKEWDFLEYRENDSAVVPAIGTCIEGIRVSFNTPGFNNRNLFAIVDTSGKSAPKTNVARSNIEMTPEKEILSLKVYELYLSHILDELNNLRSEGFSITWATNEANYMLNSLFRNSRQLYSQTRSNIEDIKSFEHAFNKTNLVLIESKENRKLISINDLKNLRYFWSIDCASYSSANDLIKEVKSSDTSALALLKTIFGNEDSNTAHIDNLICRQAYDQVTNKVISENFQVDAIKIISEQRRLDLRWSVTDTKIWEEIVIMEDPHRSNGSRCFVQLIDLEEGEIIKQTAINSSDALFILRNSALNGYLIKLIRKLSAKTPEDLLALSTVAGLLKSLFYYKNINEVNIQKIIEGRLQRNAVHDLTKILEGRVDQEELTSAILATKFVKYDTTIWYRKDYNDY